MSASYTMPLAPGTVGTGAVALRPGAPAVIWRSRACDRMRPMFRTPVALPPVFVLLLACVMSSCGGPSSEPDTISCSPLTSRNIDDCLRINQLQVLGTHNSYHIAPAPAMLEVLGERGRNLDYTHRPLTDQLQRLGIRQFEIDVFADPRGGHYARPAALRMAEGLEAPGEAMRQPGFKVLHVQDVDYRTTCETLIACVGEIRDWSRAHPQHVPIMVLIEAKDGALADPSGAGYVEPVPIDAEQLRALDGEIRSVFDEGHVLTPDMVRGAHATLHEAIRADGWPRLGDARGKVLFALDNTGPHRDRYLDGHPSLEGRVLFVSAPPGSPAAAFLKMNEALGEEAARIRSMVEAGYLVRTRADTPTVEARSGSTDRRDAAFSSGAQYVSTDYPEDSPFGSRYVARLPDAAQLPARCNPVTAPPGCRDEWLEPR